MFLNAPKREISCYPGETPVESAWHDYFTDHGGAGGRPSDAFDFMGGGEKSASDAFSFVGDVVAKNKKAI